MDITVSNKNSAQLQLLVLAGAPPPCHPGLKVGRGETCFRKVLLTLLLWNKEKGKSDPHRQILRHSHQFRGEAHDLLWTGSVCSDRLGLVLREPWLCSVLFGFYFVSFCFIPIYSQLNPKRTDFTTCAVTNCRPKTREKNGHLILTQHTSFPSTYFLWQTQLPVSIAYMECSS